MKSRKFGSVNSLVFNFLKISLLMVVFSGLAAAADFSATLQWQPSLSNGVIGYNVYRSLTPGSDYQKINEQPVAGTTYTDTGLTPGQTYYYVCRAVTADGVESSNSNEVEYFLEDPNTAPEAIQDQVQVNEDSWVEITPLENDYDDDGDFLDLVSVGQPSNGTTQITAEDTVRYTPDPDFNGSDSFTYTIADSNGKEATGTILVEVTGVNDAPRASDGSVVTDEDTAIQVDLLSKINDPEDDALTLAIVEQPKHGTASISSWNRCTYTPASDFHGTDSFTYSASDGKESDTGTITITVNPVNDPPRAADDSFTAVAGTENSFNVLGNDIDPEGEQLTVSIASPPANGSVSVRSDGYISYTSDPYYSGTDSFTYTITDPDGAKDSALVAVNITPAAEIFRAVPDSFSLPEDTAGIINVLNNDENPENISLTLQVQSQPLHGDVQIEQDGQVTYTPRPDFSGTDSFSYNIADSEGNSSVASVTVTVTEVNDPPLAVDDTATVLEDESVSIQLLANDSDIENDPLTVSLATGPSNGEVTLSTDGTAIYTPNPDYNGTDSFSYHLSDGTSISSAEVSVKVSPVNDPPEAVNDSVTVQSGKTVEFNLLENDRDPDGDSLFAGLVRAPEHGTVNINPDGTARYKSAEGYLGLDSFTYQALDPAGESSQATVQVEVTEANQPPVAVHDYVSTKKKTPVTFNVLTNDSDPDGDSLELVEIGSPSSGTAILKNPEGEIEYTPETWFRGSETFFYTVTDGKEESIGNITMSIASNPSVHKFNFPRSVSDESSRLKDTYVGVGIINPNQEDEEIAFVGFDENGRTREVIPLGVKVPPQGQIALMTSELGKTDEHVARLTVEAESTEIQGFFMVGDVETKRLDGVGGVQIPSKNFYFPDAGENENATTLLYLVSQESDETAEVTVDLFDLSGSRLSSRQFNITPNGSVSGSITDIFADLFENQEKPAALEDGYISVSSTCFLTGYEIIVTDKSIHAYSARSPQPVAKLFAPHFIAGSGNNSQIKLLSGEEDQVSGVITLMNDQGRTLVSDKINIPPHQATLLDLSELLSQKHELKEDSFSGSILIELEKKVSIVGTISMNTADKKAFTAMPMANEGLLDAIFPQVAQSSDGTIFMGFAILNPGDETTKAKISAYNASGVLTAARELEIPPLHRVTDLLSGEMFFGSGFSQLGGHIKLVSDRPLISVSIYGDYQGNYYSTVEGQLGEIEAAEATVELIKVLAEESND